MEYSERIVDDNSKSILFNTLNEFKHEHKNLILANEENEIKLEEISKKLVTFMEKKCPIEYQNLMQKYSIVECKHGIKYSPKGIEDITVLDSVNKCTNYHLGITTTLNKYQNDSIEVTKTLKVCNGKCIKNARNDSDLKLCFKFCLADYFTSYTTVIKDFSKALDNINNKL